MYDYIVIGAGPCGLTLAHYLSKHNKKILLLDMNEDIGGCHRVKRVNGRITEHGPRVYIDNYLTLKNVLKDMNTDWTDIFTPYQFSMNDTMKELFEIMTLKEIYVFAKQFIKSYSPSFIDKTYTMKQFSDTNNLSIQLQIFIDKLCRTVDGASIETMTVYEFFSIFNQNFLYNIYQPKLPNDKGLFKIWKEHFNKNITFIGNSKVVSIEKKGILLENGKKLYSKNLLITLPPVSMLNLVTNSFDKNILGNYDDLKEFVHVSKYLTYIPITYHWNNKIDLPNINHYNTDWDIVFVVLSNYMELFYDKSKTIISVSIKNVNSMSKHINKTPNNCTKEELIDETFRQLKLIYPYLQKYDEAILDPNVYRNNNEWINSDDAFINTGKTWKYQTKYPNVHWIGTHNGNSTHSYTSMESAMSSAVYWLNKECELNIVSNKITTFWDIFTYILIFFIIICILCII
jgi:hypothetical protein